MKIFKENGKIRFQLMDVKRNIMLFDFNIKEEDYEELKEHIITNLNGFNP